jgi:hypothetical protein
MITVLRKMGARAVYTYPRVVHVYCDLEKSWTFVKETDIAAMILLQHFFSLLWIQWTSEGAVAERPVGDGEGLPVSSAFSRQLLFSLVLFQEACGGRITKETNSVVTDNESAKRWWTAVLGGYHKYPRALPGHPGLILSGYHLEWCPDWKRMWEPNFYKQKTKTENQVRSKPVPGSRSQGLIAPMKT